MISNRHAHIIYIGLAFPQQKSRKLIDIIQAQADYLGAYVFHMCRGDDTNNWNILIDLGFRTENQVQLPFMSPVRVVSALGHMKSSGSGDDIGQTRQWLDFWNSSFETYSFLVLFLSLFFRENFLNPNHRRPPPPPKKKEKERNQIHEFCYTVQPTSA